MSKAVRVVLRGAALALALLGGAALGERLRSDDAMQAAVEPAADSGSDAASGAGAPEARAEGAGTEGAAVVSPVAVPPALPGPGIAPASASAPPGDHGAGAQAAPSDAAPGKAAAPGDLAYLKFPQQFFVPVVRGGTLESVMILSLALEMPDGESEAIFKQEHRLRDALLRSLLVHANSGGFDGNFTAEAHLELLRRSLLETAQSISGPAISDVLISDLARQEQ